MSFKRNKLRDAITFALVVGSAGAFGTAFAQEAAAPAAETPSELDTIVVTGTRIQSQTVTESSPVVEIQPEEFQYAGATRVDDLVNQYPQMSPYFDSFANNGATGYPTVSLRQLGPDRTLTLVNGKRGFKPEVLAVRIADRSIADVADMPVDRLIEWLDALELTPFERQIAEHILKEARGRVRFLCDVGLTYLSLNRATRTGFCDAARQF